MSSDSNPSSESSIPESSSRPRSGFYNNQTLAKVSSKWDRLLSKLDEESIRKITILRQKKISAVIKAENLHKNNIGSSTILLLKDLEEEIRIIDQKLKNLNVQRERNSAKLNRQRVQHVTALQQLSIFESLTDFGNSWEKRGNESDIEGQSSSLHSVWKLDFQFGSDPSLTNVSTSSSNAQLDENERPNEFKSKLSYFNTDVSPPSVRRNPLRMLSNAMDFRNRRRQIRPKSVDYEPVSDHPGGLEHKSLIENPSPITRLPHQNLQPVRKEKKLRAQSNENFEKVEIEVEKRERTNTEKSPTFYIKKNSFFTPKSLVKRSKTFNLTSHNGWSGSYMTLPTLKSKQSRRSSTGPSSNSSSPQSSDISLSSSPKNSSPIAFEVSPEALKEIETFEKFVFEYYTRKEKEKKNVFRRTRRKDSDERL